MQILGLMGSPRKNGNTEYLLKTFMTAATALGAQTETLRVSAAGVKPCLGCASCEKTGVCVIKDNMSETIYAKLRAADMVIVATPMFFYSAPSEMKALIDRSQTLWSRRYRFRMRDPKQPHRKGVLLALGATKGANLFTGMHYTAKYFFDAIDADFSHELTYREVENPWDMGQHPKVHQDVQTLVDAVVKPMMDRKTVLFACRENAGRSQMSAAFAEKMAGHKLRVISGGSAPAAAVHAVVIDAMAEKGIDLKYRTPKNLETAITPYAPDIIVTMGCGDACPAVPGARVIDWDLPDPAGEGIEAVRPIRDRIETAVSELINELV